MQQKVINRFNKDINTNRILSLDKSMRLRLFPRTTYVKVRKRDLKTFVTTITKLQHLQL